MGNSPTMPKQKQELPGSEQQMSPKPVVDDPHYKPSEKLKGKVGFITGADSGIGSLMIYISSIIDMYAAKGITGIKIH